MFGKNKNGCFDCDRCPANGDPKRGRFCVMWWETLQTNPTTGEERMLRSCGFSQLPVYLIEVIKASNRPAAAVESTRNEIAQGLARVAQAAALFNGQDAIEDRRTKP